MEPILLLIHHSIQTDSSMVNDLNKEGSFYLHIELITSSKLRLFIDYFNQRVRR